MSSDEDWDDDPCVIDVETRAWINWRAAWIIREFGFHRIRTCPVVLPTTDFFPGSFTGTESEVQDLLNRMCGHMNLSADQVELAFYVNDQRADQQNSLGMFERNGDRFRIWIESGSLERPLAIAATMAHELGHVHLLGHERIAEDADDGEPLTDLLTVFLGLGVITSNDVVHEKNWTAGGWSGWEMARSGYLTMDMYGYALALFSRIRDERKQKWIKHLRPDVRGAMRKTLRYFEAHGMPDLNSIRETSSRPTLVRQDRSQEQTVSDTEFVQPEETTDDDIVCQYCGEPLVDGDHDGTCFPCRASINENKYELEEEGRREQERTLIARRTLLGIVILIVILITGSCLYDWVVP